MKTSHLNFSIPFEDAREFAGLPQKTRDRVNWLLEVLQPVARAERGRVKLCEEIASQAGIHRNSIYVPWKEFSKCGDWRKLIDRRRTSEFWIRDEAKRIALPPGFIEEWKSMVEENDRKAKPAHALLIHRWKQWRKGNLGCKIQGYERCPEAAPGSSFPRGWAYSNLLNYMPSDVELAAARKGRTAAKKLIAGVITTRVGGYPFQEIQFDDMWHNFRVNVPGYKRDYRLLEFGSVDHFSTFIFKPGLKPRLPDTETGKMKMLNGRDFHLYLVNWLLDYGVHPDGTVFNVENGTASISHAFEQKLLMWFGGKLTISRSGMSGSPAFPGALRERAKGNYKVKALKEGMGNLIQNALGHIPGQTGMDRNDCPGTLTALSADNEMLLALAAVVPSLREKLQLGFLDLSEAVQAVNETYERLNLRTDHQIEGWEESGLVIDEFRASPEIGGWLSLQDVLDRCSEAQRQLLNLQMSIDPTIRRRRPLSPAECILVHQQQLIKPPAEAVPDLLGPDYGNVREVCGGRITFIHPGLGKLRFKASYQDSDGFIRRVENGTRILTHFNPWKPEFLYLSEVHSGRFIGRSARDIAVTRGDMDAIARAHGQAERDYKDAVRESAMRHGLKRLPNIKINTALIRSASAPSLRDQNLSAAGFESSRMLDDSESGDFGPIAGTSYFDPSDLL